MSNLSAFLKEPLNFKNKFKIYPASVKEVACNENFLQYRGIFLVTQDDIKDYLKKVKKEENGEDEIYPTPFEFLLINCYHDKRFEQMTKEGFEFFTKKKLKFLYNEKTLVVYEPSLDDKEDRDSSSQTFVTEEDYFDFQNMIRESLGEKRVSPPEPPDPDENPMIAKIKARARERDRIKAKQSSKNGISLQTTLTAICCMGIGLTPLNIGEMSYAAIMPIMNMMQEKEKYDIDIRSLLAGADSKKIKPKYWIRNNEKD